MKKALVLLAVMFLCSQSASIAMLPDPDPKPGRFDISMGSGLTYVFSAYSVQYGFTDGFSLAIYQWINGFNGKMDHGGGTWRQYELNTGVVSVWRLMEESKDSAAISLIMEYWQQDFKQYANEDPGDEYLQKSILAGRFACGIGLSKRLDDNFTFRMNLTNGLSAGVEMGWKVMDHLELNLGVTGMGILGLKFMF